MGVPDDDELIAAELVSAKETVFIGTHDGMCIRFPHADVREMGRQAYGVIGIRLDEGDYVVSMIASTNENDMVLSVTERGFGKRTAVEEYRTQGRGGKGIINVKTTDKERQSRRDHAGSGRFRRPRDDRQRQADPRPLSGYPRRRPRNARRAADQSG